MNPSSSTPPLAGLRVIDWTHVLAGPFAGYQLGLLGADVIRIERADGDDMIRAKGGVKVAQASNAYGKYFSHSGWKAIPLSH